MFFSAVQTISGACLALLHAYRHALGTYKRANQSQPPFSNKATQASKPAKSFPGGLMPLTPAPLSATVVVHPPPSPPASVRPTPSRETSTNSSIPSVHIPASEPTPSIPTDYVYPSLHLLGTLLSYPPRTMTTALLHVLDMLLLPFSGLISRMLPYMLYTHALSGDMLVTLVKSAKAALFPGGWPAAPPPDPTPEEQANLRKRLTGRLLAALPGPLLPLLGSDADARTQAMIEILEPLSSQECNTHLIIFILDLVLITIFPEMGVGANGTNQVDGTNSPPRSFKSVQSLMGDLTPPRPDSRPP